MTGPFWVCCQPVVQPTPTQPGIWNYRKHYTLRRIMGASFLRRTTLNKQVELFLSAILKEKNYDRLSYKTMSLNPVIIFQFHLVSPMNSISKYNTSQLPPPGFFLNWLQNTKVCCFSLNSADCSFQLPLLKSLFSCSPTGEILIDPIVWHNLLVHL